jgi:protein tyrosine phosphatase (PTP) superfamily phosphohydrolase (DUF442 family)
MNNERRVGAFTVGGQPSEDDLRRLKASGHGAVVNVRMPDEPEQVDESTIKALGLEYASVPFTGPTLSAAHVRRIRDAVDKAGGSVLIH